MLLLNFCIALPLIFCFYKFLVCVYCFRKVVFMLLLIVLYFVSLKDVLKCLDFNCGWIRQWKVENSSLKMYDFGIFLFIRIHNWHPLIMMIFPFIYSSFVIRHSSSHFFFIVIGKLFFVHLLPLILAEIIS